MNDARTGCTSAKNELTSVELNLLCSRFAPFLSPNIPTTDEAERFLCF